MKKSIVREALPKPNVLQLSQYDITQKIMESLVNACHRSVLYSIIDSSKDANAIAAELNRGRVNLLKWDKMEKSYYPVKIGLRGGGIENLKPDEEIRR